MSNYVFADGFKLRAHNAAGIKEVVTSLSLYLYKMKKERIKMSDVVVIRDKSMYKRFDK